MARSRVLDRVIPGSRPGVRVPELVIWVSKPGLSGFRSRDPKIVRQYSVCKLGMDRPHGSPYIEVCTSWAYRTASSSISSGHHHTMHDSRPGQPRPLVAAFASTAAPPDPPLVATLRSTLPLVPRLDELRILLLDGSNTASLLGSCLCLRSVLGVLQALGDADIDLMGGSRLMR